MDGDECRRARGPGCRRRGTHDAPSTISHDPIATADLFESGRRTGSAPFQTPASGIYPGNAVDRAVVPRSDNGSPIYPALLRSAGIEGDVLVRFVVDSAGRVEPNSITLLDASHVAFGDAVSRWLQRARYLPAEVAGRPVRQLVEQRFGFTLRR